MAATKIATCCYCGTKTALVLRGRNKHELSCANCGAPLRVLKMLPAARSYAAPAPSKKRKKIDKYTDRQVSRPMKRRKTKGFGQRMFSELWEVLEDVVDEVFD